MSYRIESTSYEKPLFTVDAAYIIHLENNGRLPSVKAQMAMHAIAPVVHIVFNKGYTDPKKNLPNKNTRHDIVDAYKYIFRDAKEHEYHNVLVLEDDFTFREDLDTNDVAKVNRYLKAQKKSKFIYHLGCIPAVMAPVDLNGNYIIAGSATHATIYSKSLREKVLSYTGIINDWDWYITFAAPRYTYSKPLVYQIYPETENSKNWMPVLGFTFFVKQWIKLLKLDVQPEPGYSICYAVAKALFWVGVLFSLLFVYAVYHYECTIEFLLTVYRRVASFILYYIPQRFRT